MSLDPNVDLDINIHELEEEFRTLPRLLFQYSKEYSEAEKEASIKKQQIQEVKSVIIQEILAQEEKKPTDKVMESKVHLHPTFKRAVQEHSIAESEARTLKGACQGLAAKKDMLIQLGANARKEY